MLCKRHLRTGILFTSNSKGVAGGVTGRRWLLLPDTTSIVSGIRKGQHRPLVDLQSLHQTWCGGRKDTARY